jgi:DNA-binding MarR family transcriptional regulator
MMGDMQPEDDLLDSVLTATRALVAVAARSLATSDLTLAQYRALSVIASRGPQRVVDISTELRIDSSAGTRLVDRLVRRGLVERRRSDDGDRREVRLMLTLAGRDMVLAVRQARSDTLAPIIAGFPARLRGPSTEAYRRIADALGEVPEHQWPSAWDAVDAAGE